MQIKSGLHFEIAMRHLLARKRQSIVSLSGIILGVAFFLAISSLMQGSENDFIRRLVDNSPHITITDDYRDPRRQPAEKVYNDHALQIHKVKPLTETRGIRGYREILAYLETIPGLRASPVLTGQALVSYAGRNVAISINGMRAEEIKTVSTIENYMREGSVDEIIANPDGIVVGAELMRKLSLNYGDNITVASPTGQVRTFKIVGVFRTGRQSYDEQQVFMDLKRVQALLDRLDRANSIIIKIPEAYQAHTLAAEIEQRVQYKSVSWQEASEDLMNTLSIRNTIMYTVVSAVLVVAAFGIYNVISTVVMEKQRDISILKSIGFTARDVKTIFLLQGAILGLVGCAMGLPLGSMIMAALGQIELRPPGGSEIVRMPIDWGIHQFLLAASFALFASLLAAYLPARKAAHVKPVDVLRGAM